MLLSGLLLSMSIILHIISHLKYHVACIDAPINESYRQACAAISIQNNLFYRSLSFILYSQVKTVLRAPKFNILDSSV